MCRLTRINCRLEVWRTVRSSAANSAASACGIVERLAGLIERRDAEFGQEEAHRPVHAVQPLADPAADLVVLGCGRAHERHLGIVRVQEPALVSGGHGVGAARN